MKIPKINYYLMEITPTEWHSLYRKYLAYPVPYGYRYSAFTQPVFVLGKSLYSYLRYTDGRVVYKKSRFIYRRSIPYFYVYNSRNITEEEYDNAFDRMRKMLPFDMPSNFHKKNHRPMINYIYYRKLMKNLKKGYNTFRIYRSKFIKDEESNISLTLLNDTTGYGDLYGRRGIKKWETPLDNIKFILKGNMLYLSIKNINKLHEISSVVYSTIYKKSNKLYGEMF